MKIMTERKYWDGFSLGLGVGVTLGFMIAQIGTAHGQAYVGPPPVQWCYDNMWFPARADGSCHSEDKHTVYATTTGMPPTISGNSYITNRTLSCPRDRTLVMVSEGSYKCAKDMTDPE